MGAAHIVHIRRLECKALGHFIRVLSTREIFSLGGYFWRAGLSRLWVMAEWPGEGEIELCERWGGVCGRLKRARQARFAMTSSSSRAYQEVTFTR